MDLTWLDVDQDAMTSEDRALTTTTTCIDGQDDRRTTPRTSTPSDT